MKILLFGDLHCANHSAFSTRLENGLNSRFQDCLNILNQAYELIVYNKIEVVIFLGDLFHSRTNVPVEVWSETWKAFRSIGTIESVVLFMLRGNHDESSRVGNIHSLTSFSAFAEIIEEPKRILHTSAMGSVVTMYFIPHTADPDLMCSHLVTAPSSDLMFLHVGLSEAIPGSEISKAGEISINDLPFDKTEKIISGHIHKHQFLHGQDFLYVGSPLQQNFGERNDSKYFTIYDTSTKEFQFVPTNAPKFHSFELINDTDYPEELMNVDFIKDFVKINYTKKWQEVVDLMKQEFPRIMFERIIESKHAIPRVDKNVLLSDADLLDAWLSTKELGRLERQTLMEIGLQAINERP